MDERPSLAHPIRDSKFEIRDLLTPAIRNSKFEIRNLQLESRARRRVLLKRVSVWKDLAILLAVISPSVLLYSRVTHASFCSYDDFYWLHRARYEDAQQPLRVFTTTEFDSQRYRPLSRAANLLTYDIGGFRAFPFRLRNLVFHLAGVVLLYFLGFALFSSRRVAALGALLFGVHPLANMSLVGAVVTNSLAYAFVLAACLTFVLATRRSRMRTVVLASSMVLGWLALLTYDPAVTVLALMPTFLVLQWTLARERPDRRVVAGCVAGVGLIVAAYGALRVLLLPSSLHKAWVGVPTAGQAAKNAVLYAIALVNPFDPVLGNAILGLPFPSLARVKAFSLWFMAVLAGVLLLLAAFVARRWWRTISREAPGRREGVGVAFLVAGIVMSVFPVLLFGKHPSETYLYLPAAFCSLLFGYTVSFAMRWAAGRRGVRRAVGVLAFLLVGLAAAGTWVRNQQVALCGEAATRILTGIGCPGSGTAKVTVQVSQVPGSPKSQRYGFYGFRGTDTIGDGALANSALTCALQLYCGTQLIRGEVVEPDRLRQGCSLEEGVKDHRYFWVREDGGVTGCGSVP